MLYMTIESVVSHDDIYSFMQNYLKENSIYIIIIDI